VLDNATGEAKAAIDEEKLNKALDEAKKSEDDKLVELNIKKVENADAYIQTASGEIPDKK